MNAEARRSSDSGSSNGERNISADVTSDRSSTSSESSAEKPASPQKLEKVSVASTASGSSINSGKQKRKGSPPEEPDNIDHEKRSTSRSSISSVSSKSVEAGQWKKEDRDKRERSNSDSSDSSIKEKAHYASSSTVSDSDRGLLRSILSASSTENIVTDIEVTSPKDGKFSSSTDEELLRKFREQQANRKFRPRSAKFRRDADPEPESVQKIQSEASDRGSSKEKSFSSDSSSSQEKDDSVRGRRRKKPRKGSANSSGTATGSKKTDSSRSICPSSSTHSSDEDRSDQIKEPTPQVGVAEKSKEATTESETRYSLTTNPTSSSESTLKERPPSRQGYRPKSSRPAITQTKTKAEKHKPVGRLLKKRSESLPVDSPENWPKEPGHWWPHNEDCRGEKEIQRLIEYHRRKLRNLIAQEFLQRHLEIELQRAGARFKQYERGPRPISPKQVRKFKERNITWVFLDGKLYNLNKDMGNKNTTERGRERNKSVPQKSALASNSRSREINTRAGKKSQRSVSFEKGTGRTRSSTRSPKRTSATSSASKNALTKKKKRRRGSDSSESVRKSSLSSRGSARTLSRSTSRSSRVESPKGKGSRSLSEGSRSSSRSSSVASSKGSKHTSSPKRHGSSERKTRERRQSEERPKSGNHRLQFAFSTRRWPIEKHSRKTKSRMKMYRSSSSSSSSSTSDTEVELSRSKNSKTKNKSRLVDEIPKSQPVIFTEEHDKTSSRNRRKKQTNKLTVPPGVHSTMHHGNIPSRYQEQRDDRPRTAPNVQEKGVRDDYNFYRDPNIPGHAFPYYYLSQLFAIENGSKKKRSKENTDIGRIVLRPAPVNKRPVWRTYTARLQRRSTTTSTQRKRSPGSSPMPRRKKTKSILKGRRHDNEEISRSPSQDSRSSSLNRTSSTTSHPRIRPGSGPIKCSWKAETEPENPKFPGSDHLLKNTDNPAILAWLRRKDAQLYARKQNELRKQRRKTAKLMEEENDLEEKHERALRQYELWKKDKDREILLRRRKEAKEASSAAFTKKENEIKAIQRRELPNTVNGLRSTTFSELRSSSPNPSIGEKARPRTKPRPKSANTLGVTFSDQIELQTSQRPRSAMEQRQSATDDAESFQGTEHFLESFLGVGTQHTKSNAATDYLNEESSHSQQQLVEAKDRDAYQKWVRSSTSADPKRSSRSNTKRKSKRSTPRSRSKQHVALPPHNHSENELISRLAKRRIETILSSRKRVDTGLKTRPLSGPNSIKNPTPPLGSQTEPTRKKWILREGDIVDSGGVKVNSKNSPNGSSSSSSTSSSDAHKNRDRPKFSFKRKSPTKSTRHHRNPIVREAFAEK